MENKDQIINSNEEAIVTPLEYLEQQLKQEIEAKEVLPGKFQECTYHQGHLNQPVYVCLTCEREDSREIKEKAGICYSCSIACHSKHELLELFNKRNFRCECGTKKFQNKCNLEKFIPPEEGEVIHGDVDKKGWRRKVEGNVYTENFDGIYCW
ncbi:hypothetical protein K502DRAFT_324880 [Neoconidiobolus thromboides FSU 785]|nr:hypothetical protein K502DRAFT_324880 [Neoconidiobolus thromboides FSU 785]